MKEHTSKHSKHSERQGIRKHIQETGLDQSAAAETRFDLTCNGGYGKLHDTKG